LAQVGPGAHTPAHVQAAANAPLAPEAIVQFLDLTAAQQAQWDALHETFRSDLQPLQEQRRTVATQLRELLSQSGPDPAAVGDLVIQEHSIGEKIRALRETLDGSLAALLTPEQKTRYEALKAAIRLLERRPPKR
ncbi:MAG: Spy/CpxP family protein refolding chaperone, partial [Thermoanaerobaculia bacterium]